MSYEKVRSVRFLSDDNIILESVSNNVSPKKYHKWKFTGTLIDFLRYVQGSELQIATSANGYFWSALFAISYKMLKVQNIEYSDLYSLDKDNPIWDDIVETFHTAMNYLKANRNKKCYVKNGSFYIAGRAYGGKYYFVENKEDAKKYPYCQARYMTENSDWTFEEVR